MKSASRFRRIQDAIAHALAERGESPPPDVLTRLTIEEILARFAHHRDPLEAALHYVSKTHRVLLPYTVRGYAVNATTIREAVQEARKLMKARKPVVLPLPMFYAPLPASAGVIHGEVAREFWRLVHEKYKISWRGLVREGWVEVTRKITLRPKLAMARARQRADLRAKALRRAWTKLREDLGSHGLSIADVQREAWANVLGVPVSTPVRPVEAKRTPAVKKAKRGAREPRVSVRVTAPDRSQSIETPYGRIPAHYSLSPSEGKDFVKLLRHLKAWVVKEGKQLPVLSSVVKRGGVGDWVLLRAGDKVFSVSITGLALTAGRGLPTRFGAVRAGKRRIGIVKGLVPTYSLVVAWPTGFYLFKEAWGSDLPATSGLPLDAMVAAVRGDSSPLQQWGRRISGKMATTDDIRAAKKKVKQPKETVSFSILSPEYAHLPVNDETRVENTRNVETTPKWSGYAVVSRPWGGKDVAVVAVTGESGEPGVKVGFVRSVFGPATERNARLIAAFVGERFRELPKWFTARVAEWEPKDEAAFEELLVKHFHGCPQGEDLRRFMAEASAMRDTFNMYRAVYDPPPPAEVQQALLLALERSRGKTGVELSVSVPSRARKGRERSKTRRGR